MTSKLRQSDNNPFHPGFGAVPEVWAGRDAVLTLHDRERRQRLAGRYTRGVVFVGPSGIGKSVLANRFAHDSAALGDVVLAPVRLPKRSDALAQVAAAVTDARDRVAGDTLASVVERQLKRLRLVSVKGVELAATEDGVANPHVELRDSLVGFGEILARENALRSRSSQRALVVRIDELQNASDAQRSQLLAALGDVLEHEVAIDTGDGTGQVAHRHLPVLVFLTGLPELLNRTTDVDTFRKRFNTSPLGMLDDDDITEALAHGLPGGVTVEPAAAERLATLVAGDPYLFQVLGQAAWDAGSTDAITRTDVERAERETYGTVLRHVEDAAEAIPPGEREILDAIYAVAGAGHVVRSADVAGHLGKKPSAIATAAQRLERRAAIRRDRGEWWIEGRLLRRFLTTGDVTP